MKKEKNIYYICPKCKIKYDDLIPTKEVPLRTKKGKGGSIIILETRKVPICNNCGTFLVRYSF
jgi:RNase P subunit RPR2